MSEQTLPELPEPKPIPKWLFKPGTVGHDFIQSYARAYGQSCYAAGVRAGMERAAVMLDLSAQDLRLLAGEMSAQEMRTVRAVLNNRAATIRKDQP